MKKNIIPSILFCLTMAAGCSQDEPAMETPDNGNAPGKQITVTAAMSGTGADTRLTYDDQTNAEGNGKLVVKWAESGEKIYLYNRTKQASSILQQKQIHSARMAKTPNSSGICLREQRRAMNCTPVTNTAWPT